MLITQHIEMATWRTGECEHCGMLTDWPGRCVDRPVCAWCDRATCDADMFARDHVEAERTELAAALWREVYGIPLAQESEKVGANCRLLAQTVVVCAKSGAEGPVSIRVSGRFCGPLRQEAPTSDTKRQIYTQRKCLSIKGL